VPLLADDWAYGAGGGADDWAKAAATDATEDCLVVAPSEAVAEAAALREAHFPSGALDHNGSQVKQHEITHEMANRLQKKLAAWRNSA
jgi:hypothetical protein